MFQQHMPDYQRLRRYEPSMVCTGLVTENFAIHVLSYSTMQSELYV
jgi:hypothetical protein